MKLRILMVAVVTSALFLVTGILYAADGDLIVNGNLGVGTSTPAAKAEVNGNMVVDGNLGVGTKTPSEKAEVNGNLKVSGTVTSGGQTVNGNLCVGGNCTNSLHVSGGVYGYCAGDGTISPPTLRPPATYTKNVYSIYFCTCPAGYTVYKIGSVITNWGTKSAYNVSACYKE